MGRVARKSRAALDVALGALAVLRARRLVADRPIGALVRKSGQTVPEAPKEIPPMADRDCGQRWGAAVDRAMKWIPGDSACLVRASALQQLVVTRGLPRAEVRIGVRRGPGGFEAHAWVEQDGMPIAEPVTLRGAFSSLDGVTLR